ncbi:YuiB family protein [Bacillus sp. SL00103]
MISLPVVIISVILFFVLFFGIGFLLNILLRMSWIMAIYIQLYAFSLSTIKKMISLCERTGHRFFRNRRPHSFSRRLILLSY